MAIHFNSMRTAVVSPPQVNRAGSAAPASQSNAPSKSTDPHTTFRAILSHATDAGSSPTTDIPAATSADNSIVAALTAPVSRSTSSTSAQTTTSATPPVSGPNAVLTAEDVFGANPWLTDPTGTAPNGETFSYNPLYFATPSTAAHVAQMVGGTVVQDDEFTKNTPGDPFTQQQPNEMVQLPGGGLINPGLIASLYTHGYPQSEVNQAIANEVASAEASVTTT